MFKISSVCILILIVGTTITANSQEIQEDKTSFTTGVRTIISTAFDFEYRNVCKAGVIKDPNKASVLYFFMMFMYDKQGFAEVSEGDIIYITFKNKSVLQVPFDGDPAKSDFKSLLRIAFTLSEDYIKEIIKDNSLVTEVRIESRDGYKVIQFEIPLISGLKLHGVMKMLYNKLHETN